MKRQGDDTKTIIFDCDDVLLNWQRGFTDWMFDFHQIQLDPAGPQSWDMNLWVGQNALPFVQQFNASPDFGNLQACEGSQQAIARLYAAGHSIHVITACSDHPEAIARREANLDRVFGDVFSSIICIPLGGKKADALRSLPLGAWIEDNVDHALTGREIGHRTFIMRMNHNFAREGLLCDVLDLEWIDDFEPVLNAFTEDRAAA